MGSTLEQRRAALDVANVVRLEHARIRSELAALSMREGRAMAADILRNPPPEASSLRVEWLLKACHRTGENTLRKWFLRAEVVAHARLQDIPPGKRETLAQLVGGQDAR